MGQHNKTSTLKRALEELCVPELCIDALVSRIILKGSGTVGLVSGWYGCSQTLVAQEVDCGWGRVCRS